MLIHYRKLIVTVLMTFNLEAGILDDIGSKTGKGSLTPDINILTTGGSLEDIINSITGISGELDKYWNMINTDSLKNQIYGNNEMLQCLASGIDFDFELKDKDIIGGICNTVNMKDILPSGDAGKILSCVGIDVSHNNILDNLKSLCSGGTGVGKDGTGEIDSSIIIGGPINTPTPKNPKGVTYSVLSQSMQGTIDVQLPSITGKSYKSVKDRKYPNGKTGDWLYGEGGGKLIREAKKYPNGSTANALNNFDKATIILKENAASILGHTDTTAMLLPKTKKDAIEASDEKVAIYLSKYTNLVEFSDKLAEELQKKFKDINAETTEEYYKKEKEAFANYIKNNKAIQSVYEKEQELQDELTSEELALIKKEKDYINDPSQARANMIIDDQKNNFKFLAMMQNVKNTNIKLRQALKLLKRKEEIEKAVRLSYVKASLWRGDIAKKEIDKMLSAVDQVIK